MLSLCTHTDLLTAAALSLQLVDLSMWPSAHPCHFLPDFTSFSLIIIRVYVVTSKRCCFLQRSRCSCDENALKNPPKLRRNMQISCWWWTRVHLNYWQNIVQVQNVVSADRLFFFFSSFSSLLHLQGQVHQSVLPSVLRPGPGRPHYPAGTTRSHHWQRGGHSQTEAPAHTGLHPGEKHKHTHTHRWRSRVFIPWGWWSQQLWCFCETGPNISRSKKYALILWR